MTCDDRGKIPPFSAEPLATVLNSKKNLSGRVCDPFNDAVSIFGESRDQTTRCVGKYTEGREIG